MTSDKSEKNAVPNKRTNHEMGCLFNLPELNFLENVKKNLPANKAKHRRDNEKSVSECYQNRKKSPICLQVPKKFLPVEVYRRNEKLLTNELILFTLKKKNYDKYFKD